MTKSDEIIEDIRYQRELQSAIRTQEAYEKNLAHLADISSKGVAAFKKKLEEDPEFRNGMRAGGRKGGAARKKKYEEDHDFREKINAQLADGRPKGVAAAKKKWDEDHEYRARRIDQLADARLTSQAVMKEKLKDSEYKSRINAHLADISSKGVAAAKKKWDEDPEYRKRMRAVGHKGMCVRWHGADCGCWQSRRFQNAFVDIGAYENITTTDEMRLAYEAGLSFKQIAEKSGVSTSTVQRRVRGVR